MPHLVEMQNKYGKDGLVIVSVSLDEEAQKKEVQESVARVLKSQKTNFRNFILDEKSDFWQEKLKIDGPPSIFVFNREGERKQFKEDFDLKDVEKLVVESLKK